MANISLKLFVLGFGGSIISISGLANPSGKKEDISFSAPLFCSNERKSIVYANFSANMNSFSWLTRLAYFTDGYPNEPHSYLISASSYKLDKNKINISFLPMNESAIDVNDYKISDIKHRAPITCNVTLNPKWRSELKAIFPDLKDSVIMYETKDFELECDFVGLTEQKCSYSEVLAKKLNLGSPYDGKKLPYNVSFTFKLVD